MNEPLPLEARRAKWGTPIIVANFKAHNTWDEISAWIDKVMPSVNGFQGTIILCPSASFLAAVYSKLNPPAGGQNSELKLGVQDISKFEQGSYTGEISASQIAKICQYAIVGHSERRKYFGETEEMINKKLKMATKYELTPILCISEINQVSNLQFLASSFQPIVAYEPIFAIGTGNPDTPEEAENITKTIKEKNQLKAVLYGGSVTAENVKSFTTMPSIDGVLVGTASLDSHEFLQIITNS